MENDKLTAKLNEKLKRQHLKDLNESFDNSLIESFADCFDDDLKDLNESFDIDDSFNGEDCFLIGSFE